MDVSSEQIRLIEPAEEFRDEFLLMLDEHQHADEDVYDDGLARMDFAAYVRYLRDLSQGRGLPPGYVPMTTFWLIKDKQYLLGESRLRHRLTPALEAFGGHIGYVIRPSQRRKGYGTLILKLTLEAARGFGLQRVRVTCDTDNIGSARVIEHNGGVLSGYHVSPKDEKRTSQYWIEL